MTQSVFRLTEKKLARPGYEEALLYVASRKSLDRYCDLIDFMFAETWPLPWRRRCFAYYEGLGPRLKDFPGVFNYHIKHWDICLAQDILERCKLHHKHGVRPSWRIITHI
jgi:hypothetical protein